MNFDYLLRRLLGRATCNLGDGSRLLKSARIRNIRGNSEHIHIGENSLIAGELLVFAHGGQITIGDWAFIGEGSRIWSSCNISIGNRVLVSHNVNIFDSLTHPLNARKRHEQFKSIMMSGHPVAINLEERSISIGDDAWIGANSCILRGVTLGTGTIIGAGSVVTHDIPDYTIAAGNPAVVIRTLNPNERK